MSERVSDERHSVLMAAVERNLMETEPLDVPERVALSAVHANEWTLADLRDVLFDLRDARAENKRLREASDAALVAAWRPVVEAAFRWQKAGGCCFMRDEMGDQDCPDCDPITDALDALPPEARP